MGCGVRPPQGLGIKIHEWGGVSAPGLWRTPTPEYSGVLSGEEKVLFFSPEKETGAESLKAPESVSGVLRVFQGII